MLDKKEFKNIKQDLEQKDETRERLIKDSRDVLKLSKQLIYSVHRNDLGRAEELTSRIKEEMKKLKGIVENNPELRFTGSFKVACQEYVEALAFYEFVINGSIPSRSELGMESEHYLLGLCDLTGELTRLAVNAAIKGDFEKAEKAKELVEELYGLMLELDLRNSELRKKFDSIKWDLNKLDDLMYDIKLRKK